MHRASSSSMGHEITTHTNSTDAAKLTFISIADTTSTVAIEERDMVARSLVAERRMDELGGLVVGESLLAEFLTVT